MNKDIKVGPWVDIQVPGYVPSVEATARVVSVSKTLVDISIKPITREVILRDKP